MNACTQQKSPRTMNNNEEFLKARTFAVVVDKTNLHSNPLLSLASHQQSIFNNKFHNLCLSLRLSQLATEDFDIGRGDDTKRNPIALDLHNFDSDVAVDNQLITNFAT